MSEIPKSDTGTSKGKAASASSSTPPTGKGKGAKGAAPASHSQKGKGTKTESCVNNYATYHVEWLKKIEGTEHLMKTNFWDRNAKLYLRVKAVDPWQEVPDYMWNDQQRPINSADLEYIDKHGGLPKEGEDQTTAAPTLPVGSGAAARAAAIAVSPIADEALKEVDEPYEQTEVLPDKEMSKGMKEVSECIVSFNQKDAPKQSERYNKDNAI